MFEGKSLLENEVHTSIAVMKKKVVSVIFNEISSPAAPCNRFRAKRKELQYQTYIRAGLSEAQKDYRTLKFNRFFSPSPICF